MYNRKKHFFKFYCLICFIVYVIFGNPSRVLAMGEEFWLYPDGQPVKFGFNRAGYSDEWDWGVSERHLHWTSGSHEMLSGEAASAIFFAGIQNNKSMWLTQNFACPDWGTGSLFIPSSNPYPNSWDDPCNPINGFDTGRSIVEIPSKIRVTINYNLIDIGDSNYVSLPFRNFSGNIKDVTSFRIYSYDNFLVRVKSLEFA